MNKIVEGLSGGMPIKTDRTLPHMQQAWLLIGSALGKALILPRSLYVLVGKLGSFGFIIDGCTISGSDPYSITSGLIWLDGEIYQVDSASGITGTGGLYWKVIESYLGTDPETFSDASTQNMHLIRKVTLVVDTPDPGDIGVTYFYASGDDAIQYVANTVATLLSFGLQDVWHEVDAGGEPAFENSWTYGGGHKVKFMMERTLNRKYSRVMIIGTLSKSSPATVGETIFTLPSQYRPNEVMNIQLFNTDAEDRSIQIDTDGNVMYNGEGSVIPGDFELVGQCEIIVPSVQ